MEKFKFTLPAEIHISGKDIIVTDPCYFIPDDLWQDLVSAWYPNGNHSGTEYANLGVIEFSNGAKVLYSVTAYGDGEYPVYVSPSAGKSVHADATGVDAGMIAVITIEDLKKIEAEFGFHNNKAFDVNNDWYPRINEFDGTIFADGKGNFVGDLEVNTRDTQEEEEYDEEDGDNDNEDSYDTDEEGNINY